MDPGLSGDVFARVVWTGSDLDAIGSKQFAFLVEFSDKQRNLLSAVGYAGEAAFMLARGMKGQRGVKIGKIHAG